MDGKIKSKILDSKLKAFAVGSMGTKSLSKKELEEKKKREEEKAAAQVFEEFVATFNDDPKRATGKTWVKAGVYDAGKRTEDTREKGRLYRPTSRFEKEEKKPVEEPKPEPKPTLKKKDGPKKKSNLEIFRDELRVLQEERHERHRLKSSLISAEEIDKEIMASAAIFDDAPVKGSYDTGDPNTTNLYLGNLNPKVTEQELMELFGKYGPLASIKIMWPRTQEEIARGRNCGFVAYMSRKDGERALRALNNIDYKSFEMRMGWGKVVPIPQFPIYIPPKMAAMALPPPPSGLPFNCQPCFRDRNKVPPPGAPYPKPDDPNKDEFDRIVKDAVVKVVIPTERTLLCLIHRIVEFVVREGPLFEAMIMNREITNPMYRFLFENQTPAHVYYRWKLFSILQGDTANKWRLQEFRMFQGGSVWKPPCVNPFQHGMPEEFYEEEEKQQLQFRKGALSLNQRDQLESLLHRISPSKEKVGEVMVYCIEHSDAAEEVVQCIAESLLNPKTALHKKIARLFVISDILHNCGATRYHNTSGFKTGFRSKLVEIFESFHEYHKNIEAKAKADAFKQRAFQCLRSWQDANIYQRDLIVQLHNAFLGINPENFEQSQDESKADSSCDDSKIDVDGVPLAEEENDGDVTPKYTAVNNSNNPDDDIDGLPLNEFDEDIDGQPLTENKSEEAPKPKPKGGFKVSKWETVDPTEVEAQAMTLSKWDALYEGESEDESKTTTSSTTTTNKLVPYGDNKNDDSTANEDYDGEPMQQDGEEDGDQEFGSSGQSYFESREMTEERRLKLREIELKVLQYQDELESGRRTLKDGWTAQEQVKHYRRKLLRKAERQEKEQEAAEREASKKRDERSTTSSRRKRNESSDDDVIIEDDVDYDGRSSHRRESRRDRDRRSRSSSHGRSRGRYGRSSRSPSRRSHRSRSRSPRRSMAHHSRSSSPPSPPSSRKHKHKRRR